MPIRSRIRTIPDYPKEGIQFRDITTLLKDRDGFRSTIDHLASRYAGIKIDKIAAIESRGFIIGAPLAHLLGTGFVPVRKKGKLPAETVGRDYELEYGSATIEIHADACQPGERVLIVDDLIATGGTLLAASRLFQQLGGHVAGVAAVIDLPQLGGSAKLRAAGLTVHTLCEFSEEE